MFRQRSFKHSLKPRLSIFNRKNEWPKYEAYVSIEYCKDFYDVSKDMWEVQFYSERTFAYPNIFWNKYFGTIWNFAEILSDKFYFILGSKRSFKLSQKIFQ